VAAGQLLCQSREGKERARGEGGGPPVKKKKWRGVRQACGVGARPAVACLRRRRAAVGRRGRNRGGNGAPKSGPGLQCQSAVKISFKIKFQTDLNHIQILSNFDSSKKDPPELENFERKYVCEGFKEGNNFLHRNVFRFEIYFKLKFRGSNV
jgi:hypothetical protein